MGTGNLLWSCEDAGDIARRDPAGSSGRGGTFYLAPSGESAQLLLLATGSAPREHLLTLSGDNGVLGAMRSTVVRYSPDKACRVPSGTSRGNVPRHRGGSGPQPGRRLRQRPPEGHAKYPFAQPSQACLEAAPSMATLLLCRWGATACSEPCSPLSCGKGNGPRDRNNIDPLLRSATVQPQAPGRIY